MKKIVSIGFALALLVGCGGSTNTTVPTVGTETGAATTGPISTDVTMPTTDTAPTSMPSADATVQPTTAMPSTQATALPTEPGTGTAPVGTIDPATVTQEASIPELGIEFKVPMGWKQIANENTWAPNGTDMPRIGVTSAPLSADWRPSQMLPQGATIKSSEIQTLPSGQINLYTIENSDGTAEAHAIRHNGENAYDIFAHAASLRDLVSFQPVLNTIIDSVQLNGG